MNLFLWHEINFDRTKSKWQMFQICSFFVLVIWNWIYPYYSKQPNICNKQTQCKSYFYRYLPNCSLENQSREEKRKRNWRKKPIGILNDDFSLAYWNNSDGKKFERSIQKRVNPSRKTAEKNKKLPMKSLNNDDILLRS